MKISKVVVLWTQPLSQPFLGFRKMGQHKGDKKTFPSSVMAKSSFPSIALQMTALFKNVHTVNRGKNTVHDHVEAELLGNPALFAQERWW